jgi:proteasome lid subunit RPN8/RPN11
MKPVAETTGIVRIRSGLPQELRAEARRDPRIECCGLLAGRHGIISVVLPARNALGSATAYEIAPDELFALFRRLRDEQLDHLGIYHSHPATDNAPSPTDLERAYYPHAAYFIVSPRADAEKPVRAFRIAEGRATELAIEEI